MGFPSGSVVKNLPAVQEPQEMQVQALGEEAPLRRAWQPTLIFWRIPCTEEPGELQSIRLHRVRHC